MHSLSKGKSNSRRPIRRGQEIEEEENRIPTLSLDYCCMNDGEADGVLPCLVVKCHKTKRYWSTVVPARDEDAFAIAWLKGAICESGF